MLKSELTSKNTISKLSSNKLDVFKPKLYKFGSVEMLKLHLLKIQNIKPLNSDTYFLRENERGLKNNFKISN
ncbi:hypothetical protein BpHYR1_004943 [Brachionus plicatilis]|uniref:Uncharacterized protein n=1 Tax=Brachionus plicatilis TaxID=10195 RepID=A0A3M7S0Y4_BRAPC|nr:hypothetical protein BpHYR1_004943 [Brachionus plicatilis]